MITDADVTRYVEEGFLVVPDLVDRESVEEIIADTARFACGNYPVERADGQPVGDGDEALQRILAVHMPHRVSEVMRRQLAHPGLVAVLSRITAAHLPHWDGRVKCMQSMLFVKPPGLPGQAWHQDEGFIPTRDRSLVGAWIALDDATEENGCLRVIPGSHRNGYLWPVRAHGDFEEFDTADTAYGFDDGGEILVEMRAGSVVFFNGYLLHRSFRNRSDRPRRALVNHYCNAWSLLPWSIAPGERPSLADVRAIVPVCGDDPYAWKGYDEPRTGCYIRPYVRDGEPIALPD